MRPLRLLAAGTLALVPSALIVAACNPAPSSIKGAPKEPPAEQYEVGSTFADRVLVWPCYQGKRVAMVQHCAPHSCASYQLHSGPCGAPLPIELEVERNAAGRRSSFNDAWAEAGIREDGPLRHEIPQGYGWR